MRASLSPSRFKNEDFEEFKAICESTSDDESMAWSRIMPFIAGREKGAYKSKAGIPFNNLEPFDSGLSHPKPDMYDGVPPTAIHPRVRADVGKYHTFHHHQSPSCPQFLLGREERSRTCGRGQETSHV